MDTYSTPVIPLSYTRSRAGARVSGLSVTVSVVSADPNNNPGTTLLASTACPELSSTGVYSYSWTHGLSKDTQMLVLYSVGSQVVAEEFIQFSLEAGVGARGI